MRRIAMLVLAAFALVVLTGCVVVPPKPAAESERPPQDKHEACVSAVSLYLEDGLLMNRAAVELPEQQAKIGELCRLEAENAGVIMEKMWQQYQERY